MFLFNFWVFLSDIELSTVKHCINWSTTWNSSDFTKHKLLHHCAWAYFLDTKVHKRLDAMLLWEKRSRNIRSAVSFVTFRFCAFREEKFLWPNAFSDFVLKSWTNKIYLHASKLHAFLCINYFLTLKYTFNIPLDLYVVVAVVIVVECSQIYLSLHTDMRKRISFQSVFFLLLIVENVRIPLHIYMGLCMV